MLLAIFVMCEYGYHGVAKLSAQPDIAARWLFQMGLAAEVVATCAALIWFAHDKFSGRALDVFVMACLLGIIEQSQTVLCDGLAWGIWTPISNDSSICEHEWGQWPYKIVAALAFSYLIAKGIRNEQRTGSR